MAESWESYIRSDLCNDCRTLVIDVLSQDVWDHEGVFPPGSAWSVRWEEFDDDFDVLDGLDDDGSDPEGLHDEIDGLEELSKDFGDFGELGEESSDHEELNEESSNPGGLNEDLSDPNERYGNYLYKHKGLQFDRAIGRCRCQLCDYFIHHWRMREPDARKWPQDVSFAVDVGQPDLYIRMLTGNDDFDINFRFISTKEGDHWLNIRTEGLEVAEDMRRAAEKLAAEPDSASKKYQLRQKERWSMGDDEDDIDHTGGDRIAGVIKTALAICMNEHEDCRRSANTPLPTRVIDVGLDSQPAKLHLRGEGESGSYVTLSYCWGTLPSVVLTRSNLTSFQERMPLEALPLTLLDAVEFTRRLGFRYLWIDALCILQDDVDDWLRESTNMASIYGSSVVTLLASHSTSSHAGLTFARHIRITEQATSDGTTTFHLGVKRIELKMESYRGRIPKDRAWTLQEHLLSTAIVHFETESIMWECVSGVQVGLGEILRGKFDERPSGRFATPTSVWNPSDVKATKRLDWWSEVDSRRILYAAAQDYATRLLTKETDRLAAFAGLAQAVQARAPICGKYVVGLFEGDLPAALLWYGASWTDEDDSKPWRADIPSWSWMAAPLPGRVTWNDTFMKSTKSLAGPLDARLSPEPQTYMSEQRLTASGVDAHIYLRAYTAILTDGILERCTSPQSNAETYVGKPILTCVRDFMDIFSKSAEHDDTRRAAQRTILTPEAPWAATTDRPFTESDDVQIHLARIASWQTEEVPKFDSDSNLTWIQPNRIDTYFLMLAEITKDHARTCANVAADRAKKGDGCLCYFSRIGILQWQHEPNDESLMEWFQEKDIVLV